MSTMPSFATAFTSQAGRKFSSSDKSKTIDEFSTITFGKYNQNKDSYGIYNKEPVEWILVYKDDANALFMSKYILDVKAYNIVKPNITESGVVINGSDVLASDWPHSTLREWMNDYMYNEMFSEDAILVSKLLSIFSNL